MGAIIWLASYPKSGNTWMRAFLHNLLMNTREPVDINSLHLFTLGEAAAEYYNQFDRRPLSSMSDSDIMSLRPKVHELLTHASPDSVFVKTHNFLGEIEGVPLITMAYTAGAIYIVRNPLDVAISYASHFGVSIDQAINELGNTGTGSKLSDRHAREYYGSWSLNVGSWAQKSMPSLHVVRYEDMQDRPSETFAGVAHFLGLNPPPERLERAIANVSFGALKAQEEEHGFVERTEHSRFFREGRSGGWRTNLTDQQIARIVADHREQMTRFGYLPDGF
jgi:hypothetical protein